VDLTVWTAFVCHWA